MARRHRTRRADRRRQKRRTLRQRKQRGGADPVNDINEWITLVKKKRTPLVKQPDSPALPEYTFGDLASEELTLPPQTVSKQANSEMDMTEINTNFELVNFPYEPKDIRAIGNVIKAAIFAPFAEQKRQELAAYTVEEFKTFIELAISADHVEKNSESLAYLSALEEALRDVAQETSGNAFSVTTNDERAYPLYSWYLVMNLPKERDEDTPMEAVPVLIDSPVG